MNKLIELCTLLVRFKLQRGVAGNWFRVNSLRKRDSETETSGSGLHCAALISSSDDVVLYLHSAISPVIISEYFTGLKKRELG